MSSSRLRRPDAVVFDCDGLLVDTEPSWSVAESALFAARGLPYGPEQKKLFVGRSVDDSIQLMTEIFGEPGTTAAMREEMLSIAARAISDQATVMPGAAELVAAAGARLSIAVASNSPRALVELALAKARLDGVFSVVVTADDVANPKPAPDLYLTACQRLGVPPDRALAFEDTATGVASAQAAGMATIAIPTFSDTEFSADLVFKSLEDPRLATLIATW